MQSNRYKIQFLSARINIRKEYTKRVSGISNMNKIQKFFNGL